MTTVSVALLAAKIRPCPPVGHAVSSTGWDRLSTDSCGWPETACRAKICCWSPWLVSRKSPANRAADAGTTSLESGSVRARCTTFPAPAPVVAEELATVAAASSENSGCTVATWLQRHSATW
jgi:hypothetical protein